MLYLYPIRTYTHARATIDIATFRSLPVPESDTKSRTMAPSASKPVVPQNDQVAHALAGAGGGVLSMILTYVPLHGPSPSPAISRVPSTAAPYYLFVL